ncbi:Uncharacterized protein SCF082_LOCUS8039, partial [Durusdinium trenchii]
KVSQEQHPVGYGIDDSWKQFPEKTFEFVKEPKHPLVEPTPPPWQQLSNPPDNSPRGLIKRAEAEAEAERGATSTLRLLHHSCLLF